MRMKEGFLLGDGTFVTIAIKRKDISRAHGGELHYRYTATVKANHRAVTVPYHDFSTAFFHQGKLNRRGFLKAAKQVVKNPKLLEIMSLEQMISVRESIEKQGV